MISSLFDAYLAAAMPMINISVVTICYNNLKDVQMTCATVDEQLHGPFEHWIIDSSSDGATINWLTTTPQPVYRKWAHVPKNGIADAFNQGIERATGAYIHLLNSGDVYASPTVLGKVHDFLQTHPEANWISGNIILYRGGDWMTIGIPFDKKQVYKGMRQVSHPSWFVRKEVYERLGGYKPYSLAMDYDMMCRIKDESYAYLNYTIAKFDNTGASTVNYLKSLKQNVEVYEANFGYSLKSRLWQFRLKMLYRLLETPFGKMLFRLKAKVTAK